jgi:hypothetical protein
MHRQLSLFDEQVQIELIQKESKYCPACDEIKPLDYFYRREANPDGYGYICANCENPERLTTGPVQRKW